MDTKISLENRIADLNRKLISKKPELAGKVNTARVLGEKQAYLKQYKQPIHEFIDGEYRKNELGVSFYRRVIFPMDSNHGDVPVSQGMTLKNEDCSYLSGEDISVEQDQLLFIDTETTGLAVGAGTFAFLIGIGFWTPEGFIVDQFFMRDFDEEPALLEEFKSALEPFSVLVSYNGKSYDLPLLNARFITNRMRNPSASWPHIDLLHHTRALWKRRLGDCSLGNIETEILGVHRTGDIPGWLIPRVYFEFVRGGNPQKILPVFYHNACDILSLALLTGRVAEYYREPDKWKNLNPVDIFSLARCFERNRLYEPAIRGYEDVISISKDSELTHASIIQLAFIHKRKQNWKNAIDLWHNSIEKDIRKSAVAYEELAKYYEHKVRDYKKALYLVEQAMSKLSEETSEIERISIAPWRTMNCGEIRAAWEYRKARLKGKLGNIFGGNENV